MKREFFWASLLVRTNIFLRRPEFVAVLGVLSREEIEDLAARTHELREGRKERHAPIQPPRMPQRPAQKLDSETESSEESGRENRPRYRESRPNQEDWEPRYTTPYPRSWPHPKSSPQVPYGHSASVTWPVAPVAGAAQQGSWAGRGGSPPSSPPNYVSSGKPNYQEYHDGPRKSSSKVSESASAKATAAAAAKARSRNKWRDGLKVAGIGGAAASLMSVLSEAAEGL